MRRYPWLGQRLAPTAPCHGRALAGAWHPDTLLLPHDPGE